MNPWVRKDGATRLSTSRTTVLDTGQGLVIDLRCRGGTGSRARGGGFCRREDGLVGADSSRSRNQIIRRARVQAVRPLHRRVAPGRLVAEPTSHRCGPAAGDVLAAAGHGRIAGTGLVVPATGDRGRVSRRGVPLTTTHRSASTRGGVPEPSRHRRRLARCRTPVTTGHGRVQPAGGVVRTPADLVVVPVATSGIEAGSSMSYDESIPPTRGGPQQAW